MFYLTTLGKFFDLVLILVQKIILKTKTIIKEKVFLSRINSEREKEVCFEKDSGKNIPRDFLEFLSEKFLSC